MTRKKDLKRRVRARQAKTGESYTAALAQVRKPQIPEAPDATAEARAEGFHCRAVVSEKLRTLGDLRPLFARLRQMLEALDAEACGPLFRGEPARRHIPQMKDVAEARRFVQSGELGVSRDGRMFALAWKGVTVGGSLSPLAREPLLQLGILERAIWPAELALLGLGR